MRHIDDPGTNPAHIAVEPSELHSQIEATAVLANLPPSDLQHLEDLETPLNHLVQPSTSQAHDHPLLGPNNIQGEQMLDDLLPRTSTVGMRGDGNSQYVPRVIYRNKFTNIKIRQQD